LFLGEPTAKNLVNFARKHELPTVFDMKEKTVDLLFSGERASVILFVKSREAIAQLDEEPKYLKTFRKVARNLRGEYFFAYSGI
jgi:hypothetical protein